MCSWNTKVWTNQLPGSFMSNNDRHWQLLFWLFPCGSTWSICLVKVQLRLLWTDISSSHLLSILQKFPSFSKQTFWTILWNKPHDSKGWDWLAWMRFSSVWRSFIPVDAIISSGSQSDEKQCEANQMVPSFGYHCVVVKRRGCFLLLWHLERTQWDTIWRHVRYQLQTGDNTLLSQILPPW